MSSQASNMPCNSASKLRIEDQEGPAAPEERTLGDSLQIITNKAKK